MQNSTETNSVKFTGKGGEFFQLQIVNLLLTILTLGIYSAWATVRTKQYLHGHTHVDGHAFQYHATPIQILKGRLIALACFVIYIVAGSLFPIVSFILLAILICSIPWLIVNGQKFKHQMTSYRNVRFDFVGSKKDAFLVYMLYPILGVISIYTLMPWVMKEHNEYMLKNKKYGSQQFVSQLSTAKFYRIFGTYILAILPSFVIILSLLYFYLTANYYLYVIMFSPMMQVAIVIALIAVFSIASSLYSAMLWVHLTTQTKVPNVVTLSSSVSKMGMIKLNLTNLVLFICTLGLAGPWVIIRHFRYLCSHTQYSIEAGMETMIGEQSLRTGAFGEEAGNIFDIDVGTSII